MDFKEFDIFGWKTGLYHRLFLFTLPVSILLIYASNTRTFGIILFLVGIPLFWNLRSRELGKQQSAIQDAYRYKEKSDGPEVGSAAWTRNFYHQNPEGRNPWSNSEEE